MLISNYALFHFSSSRVSRLRMFTFTHHGALIPYNNAKLKEEQIEKIEIFKTESLLLFSEVYIFCTNMCFLTTVYVYQLKIQAPKRLWVVRVQKQFWRPVHCKYFHWQKYNFSALSWFPKYKCSGSIVFQWSAVLQL